MSRTTDLFKLNRLQRKVLLLILALVVVPMLGAAGLAAQWVSAAFEKRLEDWIKEAARINQSWLEANQNDAVMLGNILSQDPGFRANLIRRQAGHLPAHLRRVADELGINLIQVYDARHRLLYSSIPLRVKSLWRPNQRQGIMNVVRDKKNLLAAVGVAPIPARRPEYFLVLGSLLDQAFMDELGLLSGLKSRLYYRTGNRFIDLLSPPGASQRLDSVPADGWHQLLSNKRPWYSADAEGGQFRGLYTPLLDSRGQVEAIMFSGLERKTARGIEGILTNRSALFLTISLLGIVIGSLIGLVLSRLILRPIHSLQSGVRRLASQDFDAQVEIHSDDELGDLAKAFNSMAVRLREARDEHQREFQRDKLAALGEVAASLAHEIRNPIGVINTASAMLEKHHDDAARRTQLIRMMREEVSRVNILVQDFLHLSRYRQPQFAVIDPYAPLERALKTCLAGREDIVVHRRLQHGEARIEADTNLLQQVWANLLGNALQAMDEGPGQLWLATRLERDEVVMILEDSGPGIPAELVPRIFEPFFTTKEHGTGLGLAIAHTLVEANGGKLELLPPKRHGARFAMRFMLMRGDHE